MPFHFPLQAVLHFRQSLEHQQELHLRAANQRVAGARHLLEQIDARIREAHSHQTQQMTNGTTAGELQFLLVCESTLSRRRREQEQELTRQEKLRDDQREMFQQARRRRETLDRLQDRRLRIYHLESARREQRDMDNLFLLRREKTRPS
jgi:flagellar export protein FliJ